MKFFLFFKIFLFLIIINGVSTSLSLAGDTRPYEPTDIKRACSNEIDNWYIECRSSGNSGNFCYWKVNKIWQLCIKSMDIII